MGLYLVAIASYPGYIPSYTHAASDSGVRGLESLRAWVLSISECSCLSCLSKTEWLTECVALLTYCGPQRKA